MRRVAFLSGFFLFTLLVSTPYYSPHSGSLPLSYAQDSSFTLEGKITEKTGSKLTVSSGDNVIFHVVFNDKTDIRKKDGSPGAGQDLHSGVTISVAGDLADSGEITAKKIEIE